MAEQDSLHRFLFEQAGVRGALVQLDASWQAVLSRRPYPSPVLTQLGQALAATVLLSASIKFEGSLILQAQGAGPIRTLVAQATHLRTLRGLALWNGEVALDGLAGMFGPGTLALTIDPPSGERYQGVVDLAGTSLAEALEAYFAQSEQLATRLWLAADKQRSAGLLIQELPSQPGHTEDWARIGLLADTVTDRELLSLPAQKLLYRLFNEEHVRMFESEPVSFRCGCSRARIAETLLTLGRAEVDAILAEQGAVDADCEFCNKHYHFDRVDIEQLFSQSVAPSLPETRH